MSKVLLTIVTIIVLFFGIRFLTEGFMSDINKTLSIREFTETTAPPHDLPERIVSPSGPNPPNAILPATAIPTIISPPETPKDPFDQVEGQLPVEDNMRYPERSIGPGKTNDNIEMAASSGVASNPVQEVHNSFRIFSPEYAQNGGYVSDRIVANDTLDEHAYTAF